MSDRREDDEERVSIEADVPEADWIEQHQPVTAEPDDDLFPSEIPEDVAEADALDQARSVPDDDFRFEDDAPIETPTQLLEDRSGEEPNHLGVSRESAAPRGCNLIAVVADVLVRSARDAARQVSRRSTRPPR